MQGPEHLTMVLGVIFRNGQFLILVSNKDDDHGELMTIDVAG